MAWLWVKLTAIYGQLFTNKQGIKDSGIWYDTLKELTPKALTSGVERLQNLPNHAFCEFPPNCLQFKALCLGFYDELRLPKVQEAYQEVKSLRYRAQPNWSHKIVAFVAHRLPSHFWDIESEREAFHLFKQVYGDICNLVKQGHEVPDINEPLKLAKPINRDLAHAHLQRIKQILKMSA